MDEAAEFAFARDLSRPTWPILWMKQSEYVLTSDHPGLEPSNTIETGGLRSCTDSLHAPERATTSMEQLEFASA